MHSSWQYTFCLFITASLFGCNTVNEKDRPTEDLKANHSLVWHWEGDFSETDKTKLKTWIISIDSATKATLGVYPFDVHVYFEPAEGSNSVPVPFGLASRKGGESKIRLFVDSQANLVDLLNDWTAPHELSHLAMPFLGKKNKWFTEGFATYLSRKIQVTRKAITPAYFDSLYRAKIHATLPYYNSSTKTFVEVSDSLMQHHRYKEFYWGGASYFMTLDSLLLIADKEPFIDIMKAYQSCCRFQDDKLEEVIHSFDRIINDSIAFQLYQNYIELPSMEVMKGY